MLFVCECNTDPVQSPVFGDREFFKAVSNGASGGKKFLGRTFAAVREPRRRTAYPRAGRMNRHGGQRGHGSSNDPDLAIEILLTEFKNPALRGADGRLMEEVLLTLAVTGPHIA